MGFNFPKIPGLQKEEGDDDGSKEPEGPPKAGYRPMWGNYGMITFFWTLILFPLGVIGLLLFSPVFILLLLVCAAMFAGGAVMTELEHRDPTVPEHQWQIDERKQREEEKKRKEEEEKRKKEEDKKKMEEAKKKREEEEKRKKEEEKDK